MNVSELIKVLNDIEDKTLPVRVLEDNPITQTITI